VSVIRLNPPGQPVRYVELGPARGRLTAAGGRSLGGPLREQESPWARNARLTREYKQRLRTARESALAAELDGL
jgi:hypothetical protein